MKLKSFNRMRISLLRAEDRCINHLNELAFQGQPSWDDIHQGFLSVDELKDILADALDAYPFYASGIYGRAMERALRSSAITLTESLLLLDEVARNYRSHS